MEQNGPWNITEEACATDRSGSSVFDYVIDL
jgi:hypothetical protein